MSTESSTDSCNTLSAYNIPSRSALVCLAECSAAQDAEEPEASELIIKHQAMQCVRGNGRVRWRQSSSTRAGRAIPIAPLRSVHQAASCGPTGVGDPATHPVDECQLTDQIRLLAIAIQRDEKAHRPRRGPFHAANNRKVRENADAARPCETTKLPANRPDSEAAPHD